MIQPSSIQAISPHPGVNTVPKDPWLAVNLSMFFPGIGQLYAGKPLKGILWAILQGVLILFSVWSIFSPSGRTGWGLGGLGAIIIVYLVNILDAHLSVYLSSQDKTLERIPRKRKNPWFAVFASRIIPGLGQLYADKVLLGVIFLAASLIFLKLDDFYATLLFVPPVITAIATYHVYHTFPHSHHPHRYTYRSILALMVGAIFAWGILCNYFPNWLDKRIELFDIPSESMQPTLQVGDRIFVEKSANYRPKLGDVIVFHTPIQVKKLDPVSGDFFVKRVIGISGDKIQVRRGQVYLNDRPLEETYTAELANYELAPFLVPPKALFVLGDNRTHSLDSHAWGFLSDEMVVGRAYKIYWPLNHVRSLIFTGQ